MLQQVLPRPIRAWLRGHDAGFQWLQAEVAQRDQRLGQFEAEAARRDQQIGDLEAEVVRRGQRIGALECTLADTQTRLERLQRPELRTTYFDLSVDDIRAVAEHGLFIVGNARSGTSILLDCFNLSPEVFLFGEANLYIRHLCEDFAEEFNRLHVGFKNRRGKGTYVPPSPLPESGGVAALRRMALHHRYVGEKVTFGPHGTINGQSHQEAFFAFQARWFYASKYFLILRTPAECVWSMKKVFPDRHPSALYESWLRTLEIQLDLLHTFPNVYLIFFDNLSAETFPRINALLGTQIEPGPGILREDRQRSRLDGGRLPPELSAFQQFNDLCVQLYLEMKEAFCPRTLTFKPIAAKYVSANVGFSAVMHDRIDHLLATLPPR
jgi:hypothetical protein